MSTHPKLSSAIVIDPPVDGYQVAFDKNRKKYYRLGSRECTFLQQLDGSRSVDDIKHSNSGDFAAGDVDKLLAFFQANLMLEAEQPLAPASTPWNVKRVLSVLSGSSENGLVFWNPDAFLSRHAGAVHALFSPAALALYLAIFLAPLAAFAIAPRMPEHSLASLFFSLSLADGAILFGAMLLVVAGHELAHACVCKHFGGAVEKIGITLMYLMPLVYCDVSASWRFATADKKILVALAGIIFQLLLSCLLGFVWMLTGNDLLMCFIYINTAIALFNLFPFIKLDGYWIAVHLSGIPSLQKEAILAFENVLRRLLLGQGAPRHAAPAWLPWFGAGAVVAIPAFWILGIISVDRYLSMVSPAFAGKVTIALSLFVALRIALKLRAHLNNRPAQAGVAP